MTGEPRMANQECRWNCPDEWSEWSHWLAAGLHARNRWRLPVVLLGQTCRPSPRMANDPVYGLRQEGQNVPGNLRSRGWSYASCHHQGRSLLARLFLYRHQSQCCRDHRSVLRSSDNRARLPRCERSLGNGPTTSEEHLDQRCCVQFKFVDALSRRTIAA